MANGSWPTSEFLLKPHPKKQSRQDILKEPRAIVPQNFLTMNQPLQTRWIYGRWAAFCMSSPKEKLRFVKIGPCVSIISIPRTCFLFRFLCLRPFYSIISQRTYSTFSKGLGMNGPAHLRFGGYSYHTVSSWIFWTHHSWSPHNHIHRIRIGVNLWTLLRVSWSFCIKWQILLRGKENTLLVLSCDENSFKTMRLPATRPSRTLHLLLEMGQLT